jgi:hypothetical protein
VPNWCWNQATISGPKPVIDEIKTLLTDPTEDSRLLKWMRPIPEDQRDNWYDWCVANWGSKWDIANPCVQDLNEEDAVTFTFDTAWTPPVEAFRHWAEQDGRVTYRLSFIEEGMMFVGWDSYDGEYFDDDGANHDTEPERYWEMAQEEFGIEREEEPEPLTEWYLDGAREKGLLKHD